MNKEVDMEDGETAKEIEKLLERLDELKAAIEEHHGSKRGNGASTEETRKARRGRRCRNSLQWGISH
jgi:hypothetical protein